MLRVQGGECLENKFGFADARGDETELNWISQILLLSLPGTSLHLAFDSRSQFLALPSPLPCTS